MVLFLIYFCILFAGIMDMMDHLEVRKIKKYLTKLEAGFILIQDNNQLITDHDSVFSHPTHPCVQLVREKNIISPEIRSCKFILLNRLMNLNLQSYGGDKFHFLHQSIPGVNFPYLGGSLIAFDVRYIPVDNRSILPIEAGHGSAKHFGDRHGIIMRSVKRREDAGYGVYDVVHKGEQVSIGSMSPRIAKRLDESVDTGKPYVGNIICGKNPSAFNSGESHTHCNDAVITHFGALDEVVNADVNYVDHADRGEKSCLCVFLMNV